MPFEGEGLEHGGVVVGEEGVLRKLKGLPPIGSTMFDEAVEFEM